MTAPWTPQERRMRAALEGVMELAKEWSNSASSLGHPLAGSRERSAVIEAEEALEEHINAALSEPPTPDPRDEALRLAEQCLSNIKDDLIRSINQTTLCHHRPINDREREAAALCCGEGYGNMMSILSTQWHLSVGGGAFVVGECVTTAQNQVKDVDAALAAIAAAKGEK